MRFLAIGCLIGALVAGCVSIAPTSSSGPILSSAVPSQSTAPVPTHEAATPSVSVATVAPTQPAPTTAPSAPPQPTPTAAESLAPPPTTAPQSPGQPQQSPAGVENYGASTPLINDSFDDPDSGWGVGTNAGGSVTYQDSKLMIDAASGGAFEYTTVMTGSTSNAVHLEALFTPSGTGRHGLLCAERDDTLYGATEDPDGMYAFIRVDSNGTTTLSQGQLDALKLPPIGMELFDLDCAGTATGSFRMQLSAPGTNMGVQYFAPIDEGPRSFDRVGLYAGSGADPFSVSVDYVIAFGGTGDTSMSPAAKELLTHVPAVWQPNCFEGLISAFAVGAKADVLCQLSDGRSDYADYTSFRTQADMDGYFQHIADKYAVPEQGQNCDTGPHQGTYTIGGQPAGKLMCGPSETGTQFIWTTNDLLIFSQLIDVEGSYADMYTDWQSAGPY